MIALVSFPDKANIDEMSERYIKSPDFTDDNTFSKHTMKASFKLTSVFEEASEEGYISYIEEIAGVNSQGKILEEEKEN